MNAIIAIVIVGIMVSVYLIRINNTNKSKCKQDNLTELPTAKQAYKTAISVIYNRKQLYVADLISSVNKDIQSSALRWYAYEHPNITNNIKDNFTEDEIRTIFEPLGYKVSFVGLDRAELLSISWANADTEEG